MGRRSRHLPASPERAAELEAAAVGDGATLIEIAEVIGVSRQRVEQIEKAALAKLRRRCAAAGLYWHGREPADPAPARDPDLPEGW